jgi:hypothetical protein
MVSCLSRLILHGVMEVEREFCSNSPNLGGPNRVCNPKVHCETRASLNNNCCVFLVEPWRAGSSLAARKGARGYSSKPLEEWLRYLYKVLRTVMATLCVIAWNLKKVPPLRSITQRSQRRTHNNFKNRSPSRVK